MPLPPALLAKLAKRGIITSPKEAVEQSDVSAIPEPETGAPAEEEIIAEDYDETPPQTTLSFSAIEPQVIDPFMGYTGCPNKWNVYHECANMCRDQWSDVPPISKEYDSKRVKMLSKYPLPVHWKEVLDQGIGRFYYWNTETELVSWLPPGHPRCQVSRSAATLRKEMMSEVNKNRLSDDDENEISRVEEEDDEDRDDSDRSEDSEEELSRDEKRERKLERRERSKDTNRERDRDKDRKGRRRAQKEELDPMDPASYGECGRGTWSSGLPKRNEARTGADVTASGPLFQMRPYPSPGAVLRANAAVNPGPIGPKKS